MGKCMAEENGPREYRVKLGRRKRRELRLHNFELDRTGTK